MVIFQWAKTVPKKQKQHQQGLLTASKSKRPFNNDTNRIAID